jgi:integrase
MVADRIDDLLEAFIAQHHSQNRSGREASRLLRRELGAAWGDRSIHGLTKRDVIELVSGIEERGAPVAANKALKAIKTFLRWCVGRAVLDQSPADGIPLPTKEVARDRVLNDDELVRIVLAAREMGGPYGGIVEFLALTGQRREEAARARWDEFDLDSRTWLLPNTRTKNAKHACRRHLCEFLALVLSCKPSERAPAMAFATASSYLRLAQTA